MSRPTASEAAMAYDRGLADMEFESQEEMDDFIRDEAAAMRRELLHEEWVEEKERGRNRWRGR